ncbi:MAG: LytTR family DNA-binding domain-containing protein [Ferruginibacter sp.]
MNNMLQAIIIDDEKNSRNALRQKLINHCPEVNIIAECDNGDEGIQMIVSSKPDIVFLDVEMPRMNGFTMLQQLHQYNPMAIGFEIIFITAYDHYAIKAIKFSALDYLLKPVEIEDLKSAVEKVTTKRKHLDGNKRVELLLQNLLEEKTSHQRIAISSMEGLQFIPTDDIIYLEANGNYTSFYITGNRKITATKTLKDFEELLPASMFIRIHHSHLINKNGIEKYIKGEGGQVVMKNGVTLDVARRKKEEFMKAIGH